MARIPASPASEPDPIEPEASQGEDPIAAAAAAMGFDPATMDDNTRSFIEAMEAGQLDSLPPGGDPDNPLIPPPAEDDGATPSVDAEGVGVGLDPDASGADGGSDTGTPAVATPAVDDALPPTVPTQSQGETVNVGGVEYPIAVVQQVLAQQQILTEQEINTLALMRQGLVAPTMVDPQTGMPIVPAQQQQPQQQDEWLDPQAQAAFARLNEQQQQIVMNQRQLNEQALQQERIGIAAGLQAGIELFKSSKGLTDEQAETLLGSVNDLGLLDVYGRMYANDPRSAIAASLDAVYWNTPAYRDAELQRFHAEQVALNKPIEDKKAAGGSIASSPGSVPRTAPATPANRQQADAGMVAMIEQAMNGG